MESHGSPVIFPRQVMAWHPHGAFAIAALCFTSHYWVGGSQMHELSDLDR